MSEDKDAEIARLRDANENNLAGWSNDRAGLSGKIAQLEAEVASAARHTDRLAACVSNGDGVIRRLESEVAKLTRDWEAMNKAADQFCADWKRAESRLSALAAAARTYRYSEREYGGGLRPEFAPKVAESGAALDALLSGEEGR